MGTAMARFAFCPKCAGRLDTQRLGRPPRDVPMCRSCGFVFWQNPKPTASVLIHRLDEVLLTRRAVPPSRGAWDIPGGFINPGEDAAEAARREIVEELGVPVLLERLIAALPDTYGEDEEPTLNLYYAGTIEGEPAAATDDVDEWRWFRLDRVPDGLAFAHSAAALDALRRFLAEGRL